MTTVVEVADFIKDNMDFARFSKLTRALGSQANDAQLRFIKALIFEQSVEEYSKNAIKYVGKVGCDLIIPALNDAKVEMKYTEDALYTEVRKELREHTGGIKLMNSNGTNTHKVLPPNYADFLIYIGNQGAMLFDKQTFEKHILSNGDGITANIPTSLGIVLATPKEMSGGNQPEVDFVNGLMNYIRSYIQQIK